MTSLRAVVVIPARGGSKGIIGKNLRPVGGRALIVRAVQAARAAACVDLVVVSTDDAAIGAAASAAGAVLVERPAAISGDRASSEAAVLHALEVLEQGGRALPDVVVLMQCTSPFTTGADIDALVMAVGDRNADCALSVVEDHGFLWGLDESGFGVGVNHDHTGRRRMRQELPPQFRENGALYAMRVAPFRASGNRFCGTAVPVPMAVPHIEIDEEADLLLCDAMAAVLDRPRLPASTQIQVVVTDFDGVHTDDRVLVDQDGREAVFCSRSDGMGVEMLRRAGFQVLILSKERNPVVAARASKLQVACLQGIEDKLGALSAWLEERGLGWASVAYLGNDINDAACLGAAGLAVVPADAHHAVRAGAMVLQRNGGYGAIRELAEFLLDHRRAAGDGRP